MAKKKERVYTRDELIEIMKEQFENNPNSTTKDFRVKNGLPHYTEYIKEFGTYNNALVYCNIPTTRGKTSYKNLDKEDINKDIILMVEQLGYIPSATEYYQNSKFSRGSINKLYGGYGNLLKENKLKAKKDNKSCKYSKDYLLSEIQRYVQEFDRVPNISDFENLQGYPSRKTFTNHFVSFNEAIRLAGFIPNKRSLKEYDNITKEEIIDYLNDYSSKLGRTPTVKEMDIDGCYSKHIITRIFGSYNNALNESGLELNSTSEHSDEYLKDKFFEFMEKNGRPPRLHEFNNNKEYPSFWCYQNRFGSWNKMFMAYGVEPNDSNRKYYLEDGEVCTSSYEFDISTWLKNNNYQYERNIKYVDIHDTYSGKMDCDYLIYHNNKHYYVEMAGMIPRKGLKFEKWGQEEKKYFFKLQYKIKLLKEAHVHYKIIYPSEIINLKLEEIFSFMK